MAKGILKPNSRRDFFQLFGAASGLVTASTFLNSLGLLGLTSCSTLDEYLIEDRFDYEQEVLIVGGGISGLTAAYELKKNRIPFVLFDDNIRLGGKILSLQGKEWGAFEFSKKDTALTGLLQQLQVKTQIVQQQLFIQPQTQKLISELQDINEGLIPNKQIRTQHRLVSLSRFGSKYTLTFRVGDKTKVFSASNVLLALPAQSFIDLESASTIDVLTLARKAAQETVYMANIRLMLELSQTMKNSQLKVIKSEFDQVKLDKNESLSLYTKDKLLVLNFRLKTNHPLRQINHLELFLTNAFNKAAIFDQFKLTAENCFDWGSLRFGLDARASSVLSSWKEVLSLQKNSRLKIISEAMVDRGDADKSSSVDQLIGLAKTLSADFV